MFDFKARRLWLEEGSSPMLVRDADPLLTGGADPATEAEKQAAEQADRILKGPRAPRTTFQPIKTPGFVVDAGNHGRVLDGKVYFREIHVSHQSEPAKQTGRSYLYFWPGGQTELAYIQLSQSDSTLDADNRTLVVHPITGKVKILPGLKTVPISSASETGERDDPGGF
ncbi:MAG: prepilin-type cleavage/methylation domain-containing protein [Polyangiaceae bacterium]